MSKKHFNALAAALVAQRDNIPADAYEVLVRDIADICKASNSAFCRDRFFAACQ